MSDLRERLKISEERLKEVNDFILDPENELINRLLELVEKYGGPEEINRKATEARKLENLLTRLREEKSPYLVDLEWLTEQRDSGAFIKLADYRKRVLGDAAKDRVFNEANAVTLEISALNFFPWLIPQAEMAIEKRQLMPGRFIRVRNMKEQVGDNGDILAVAAAMQIVGASYVETLDTKGTDGSNIHLGGPETITGYFGGIGQPNDYPLKWADEYLHYFTHYGIRQVLNINPGTIFIAYLLYKLGIDNEFKISVYMGNDNPFAVFWTLMAARMLSRDDGTTSLIGLNFSNSVNNDTIRASDKIRSAMGLTDGVRFEHHITETYKSIVIQPYNRRDELVEVAKEVPNISAKHEGGDPEIEETREHPSDILEYFLPKEVIAKQGLADILEKNYLDKQDALNKTANALTRAGIGVICAKNLHE
jgi:bifunctional DNA-binding transcriptional regulator/antitoxin component of YhaV-PrlF toxin-antitoxin module